MKAGDVVTVYEDPLTENKPEGEAELIEQKMENVRNFEGLDLWLVRFLSDDVKCFRFIKRS